MTISTSTFWKFGALHDENLQNAILEKTAEMVKEGKTDGLYHATPSFQGPRVTRTWTSLEAAEEWKEFISKFESAVSTEIMQS